MSPSSDGGKLDETSRLFRPSSRDSNEENGEIRDHVKIHIETKERSTIPRPTTRVLQKRQTDSPVPYFSNREPDTAYPQPVYEPIYAYPSRIRPDSYKPRVHVSIEAEKRNAVPHLERRTKRDLSMEYTKNIVVPDRAENNMGVFHVNRVNEDIENTEKRNKILKVDKRALYGPLFRIGTGLAQRRATIKGSRAMKNPIVQLLRAAAGQKTQKILGLNSKAFDIFPGPLPDETNAALTNNLGKVSSEAPPSQMPVSVDQQIIKTFKPAQRVEELPEQQQQELLSVPDQRFIQPQMAQVIQQPNPELLPQRNAISGFSSLQQMSPVQEQQMVIPQQQAFAEQPMLAPPPQAFSEQPQEEGEELSQQIEQSGQEVIQNADFLREKPQFPSFPQFEREMPSNIVQETANSRQQIMPQSTPQMQAPLVLQQPQQQSFLRESFPPVYQQSQPEQYQRQPVREMGGETRAIRTPNLSPRMPPMYEYPAEVIPHQLSAQNFIAPQETPALSGKPSDLLRFGELRNVGPAMQPFSASSQTAQSEVLPRVEKNRNEMRRTRQQLPFPMLSNTLFQVPGEISEDLSSASGNPTQVFPSYVGRYPNAHRRYHPYGPSNVYHNSLPFDPSINTHPVFSTHRPAYYNHPGWMFSPHRFVSHIPRAPPPLDDDDDFDEKPEVHVHITTEKSKISKPDSSPITTAKKSNSPQTMMRSSSAKKT